MFKLCIEVILNDTVLLTLFSHSSGCRQYWMVRSLIDGTDLENRFL